MKYDYKNEWVHVWHNRMKELGEDSLRTKRKLLLKKFQLSEQDIPPSSQNDIDTEVNVGRRSPSPWEIEDKKYSRNLSPPSCHNSDKSNSLTALLNGSSHISQSLPKKSSPKTANNNIKPLTEFSVIGTLKLLNELEAQLGSFEPAVNVLLENAISLIGKGNQPITLFCEPDNMTLISLVQEKLNTQVSSGILNPLNHNKTKLCLESITWLQNEVGFKKNNEEQPEEYLGLNINKLVNETMGMNNNEVATHIAMSLLKIGKSNASEDDLNKILTSVLNKNTNLVKRAAHNKSEAAITNTYKNTASSTKSITSENTAIKLPHSCFNSLNKEIKNSKSQSISNITNFDKPYISPKLASSSIIKNLEGNSINDYKKNKIDLPKQNSLPLRTFTNMKPQLLPPKSTVSGTLNLTNNVKQNKNENFDANATQALFPSGASTMENKNTATVGLSLLQDAYMADGDDEKEENMELLSLVELHKLLLNYKDISKEKQTALNTFLKKLEATDSQKVTKLRAMVTQSKKMLASNKKK